MSWNFDRSTKVWKCTDYTDLEYAEIVNFAEYGQPFSPYEKGYDQSLESLTDMAHIVIEMSQEELMRNGYGQKVSATHFPIVKRFLKEELKFPYGQYSFSDLVTVGFATKSDRTLSDSLYGSPFSIAVPGKIPAPDAAFIHGTVSFKLMKSTAFLYKPRRREVRAEIGAGDDNWDFESSTVPKVVEAAVATVLGPDHYNLEGPIAINFRGPGKKSWAAEQCLPAPLQKLCVRTGG